MYYSASFLSPKQAWIVSSTYYLRINLTINCDNLESELWNNPQACLFKRNAPFHTFSIPYWFYSYNRLSAFLLLTTGISGLVSSFLIGRSLDKCSSCANLRNYFVIGAISYLLALAACLSRSFNLVWFFASSFIGIVECYFQTMIMSFFGRTFKEQKREAFAIYLGYQGIGAAICSFISPFFL